MDDNAKTAVQELTNLESEDVSTLALSEDTLKEYGDEFQMSALQLQAVMKTYGKGMNLYDFNLFLSKAKDYWLSVQRGEIWWYKDSKWNIVMFAWRDGFLALAQRNPKYRWLRSSEVRKNDVFCMDIANGTIKHQFDAGDRWEIIWAYAIAYAADSEPTIERVDMKTYNKWYNTWKSHPAEMIKKVAEVHALKKAFGVWWLYVSEEADSMWMAKWIIPWDEMFDDSEFVENTKEEIHEAETEEQLKDIAVKINKEKKNGTLSKPNLNDLLLVRANKQKELKGFSKDNEEEKWE